jgi:hypothetical protein
MAQQYKVYSAADCRSQWLGYRPDQIERLLSVITTHLYEKRHGEIKCYNSYPIPALSFEQIIADIEKNGEILSGGIYESNVIWKRLKDLGYHVVTVHDLRDRDPSVICVSVPRESAPE